MSLMGLKGIGVIIDDDVHNEDAYIYGLAEELASNGIPLVKYDEMPSDDTIKNIGEAAFIILDWKLFELQTPTPIDSDVYLQPNAALIRQIKEYCFCPIFVFTSEINTEKIVQALIKEEVIEGKPSDMVLVRNKQKLTEGKLESEVFDWIKKNPSIYTLLSWSRHYERAKQDLFSEFYRINNSWPKVLWRTYIQDGVEASNELASMITRNIASRMIPFELESSVFEGNGDVSKGELRDVLAGEQFINESTLRDPVAKPGDFFKIGTRYYLNVRPECDCVQRGSDPVELYLLRAIQMGPTAESKVYRPEGGNFTERSDQAIVFNLFNSKSFCIRFKRMEIMNWDDIKGDRLGRLLHPYSTRVVQRYSQYLQKPGLPRIPTEAVIEETG